MSLDHCPSDPELVSFLGGSLAPERAKEIAMHLAACQDCRHWMAGMGGASASRARSQKRFRLWIWIAAILGVALIAILVLIVLAGQKLEKLSAGQAGSNLQSEKLFKIWPERAVAPGGVFPVYSRDERLTIDRSFANGVPAMYLLEPGKGMQRIEVDRSNPISPPAQRGVSFYLALEFPSTATPQNIAEFEKSMDEMARRSPPMNLLSAMTAALVQRRWVHQITPIEWEN